jgi:sulfur carrier protein
MLNLKVNGETLQAAEPQTVRQLVERLGFSAKPVAVEVNKQLVPRRQHEQTILRDGDVIEVVTLVGGG